MWREIKNGAQAKTFFRGVFTAKYNLARHAYYAMFCYPKDAIAREKEIKGWRRSKKLELIESMNPHWKDLAVGRQNVYKPDAVSILTPDPSRTLRRSG